MPRRKQADPIAAKVGERIRALRVERGMSMSAVAKAAGLSKGHVTNVERGFAQATVGTLVSAAHALGVPPSMLLVFPGEEPLGSMLEHLRVSDDDAEQTLLAMAPPPPPPPPEETPQETPQEDPPARPKRGRPKKR
ncbi:helix-turn-helix domain-containing protein [Polyangium aurulentum]|uniref:helix-turn-helix domain-containing protein n=1 Tax=Polyangium aurulentum TaxID=2567896 RepID=UPI0010AE1884|nr:helix-turn-helix transcriptional regulator [Polyangium aurulentum]UQA63448.1 helix-turn-helix domain-containing protein [Polyangium aurulentum]